MRIRPSLFTPVTHHLGQLVARGVLSSSPEPSSNPYGWRRRGSIDFTQNGQYRTLYTEKMNVAEGQCFDGYKSSY